MIRLWYYFNKACRQVHMYTCVHSVKYSYKEWFISEENKTHDKYSITI